MYICICTIVLLKKLIPYCTTTSQYSTIIIYYINSLKHDMAQPQQVDFHIVCPRMTLCVVCCCILTFSLLNATKK